MMEDILFRLKIHGIDNPILLCTKELSKNYSDFAKTVLCTKELSQNYSDFAKTVLCTKELSQHYPDFAKTVLCTKELSQHHFDSAGTVLCTKELSQHYFESAGTVLCTKELSQHYFDSAGTVHWQGDEELSQHFSGLCRNCSLQLVIHSPFLNFNLIRWPRLAEKIVKYSFRNTVPTKLSQSIFFKLGACLEFVVELLQNQIFSVTVL